MLKSLHQNNNIPVTLRLSEATRDLAKRYLDGEFHDTVIRTAFRHETANGSTCSDNMKYALTVKMIA